jgi:hypothetical protein
LDHRCDGFRLEPLDRVSRVQLDPMMMPQVMTVTMKAQTMRRPLLPA